MYIGHLWQRETWQVNKGWWRVITEQESPFWQVLVPPAVSSQHEILLKIEEWFHTLQTSVRGRRVQHVFTLSSGECNIAEEVIWNEMDLGCLVGTNALVSLCGSQWAISCGVSRNAVLSFYKTRIFPRRHALLDVLQSSATGSKHNDANDSMLLRWHPSYWKTLLPRPRCSTVKDSSR
jgi:hypothetical protein